MDKRKTALYAAAVGTAAFSLLTATNAFSIRRNLSRFIKKTQYYMSDSKKQECEVLFIGDSITWLFDLKENFGDKNYINRGISGDKTTDILARCEHTFQNIRADKIVLLAGINDLNVPECESREVLDNLYTIVELAKAYNKGAKIFVESVYPVNNTKTNKRRDRCEHKINEVNLELSQRASEKGYTYIDMHSVLRDENGGFTQDYTYDGLHPSKEGFKVIAKALKEYL